MDTEQLLSDDMAIEELARQARRRGYFVLALSPDEVRELVAYFVGIFVGVWIVGGLRG